MPDQLTEVTKTGYGTRIMNSIKGIVVGFVVFLASFGVLFWNEGRVDLSTAAKKATEISSTQVSTDEQNSLVSVTGTVATAEKIGDAQFLQPDQYLTLTRNVEQFAWVEEQKSTSKDNLGGSETTETTYSYTKKWTSSPASSADFKVVDGHQNPPLGLKATTTYPTTATVGVYAFTPQTIQLPSAKDVVLTDANTIVPTGAVRADSQYVYIPVVAGSAYGNPQVGDVRISFSAVLPGFEGTVLGQLSSGAKLTAYTTEDGESIYRLFPGSRQAAIATLHSEHSSSVWLMRAVGFFMMWLGLAALFGPISTVVNIVPIFGAVSRSVIGLVTFVVAVVLSFLTILLSMILHSLVAIGITAVIIVAAVVVGVKMLKSRGGAKPQSVA